MSEGELLEDHSAIEQVVLDEVLIEHPLQLTEEEIVFTNRSGNVLEYGNLLRRHLKPIVEEVNAPWAGFHTFRHTFASLHLSQGTNLLQLSRALGHHSAAFTLSRYTHLLPGDEAPALELPSTPDPCVKDRLVYE
jgi:integrase